MKKKTLLKTLELAKKGRGFVAPNPEVGCVIIKNGKIIGEGWHKNFGGNHAEVEAIIDAEKKNFSVEGSEVFVSLEPCCHTNKKTPPCSQILIQKKVKSVYIFFQDPNPQVEGKGIKTLQEAGIKVFFADKKLQEKYKNFYEIFSHTIQKKFGFWTLKLAQTQEFFLGEKNKQIQITGKKCRDLTLQQRDKHQAILVGVQTVLTDNPNLRGKKTSPLRIILDPKGKLLGKYCEYRVFRDKNFIHVVSQIPLLPNKKIDLNFLKKFLYEKNIHSVFIEGGGKTARKMIEQKVLNKGIFYQSTKKIPAQNSVQGIDFKQEKKFQILSEEIIYEEKFEKSEVKIFIGNFDFLSIPNQN